MKIFLNILAVITAPMWVPVYVLMLLAGKRETVEFDPSKPYRIIHDDSRTGFYMYCVVQRCGLFWNPCEWHGELLVDWDEGKLKNRVEGII